jgi:hypothetical protein
MCVKNAVLPPMTFPANLKLNLRMNIHFGVHSLPNLKRKHISLSLKTIDKLPALFSRPPGSGIKCSSVLIRNHYVTGMNPRYSSKIKISPECSEPHTKSGYYPIKPRKIPGFQIRAILENLAKCPDPIRTILRPETAIRAHSGFF